MVDEQRWCRRRSWSKTWQFDTAGQADDMQNSRLLHGEEHVCVRDLFFLAGQLSTQNGQVGGWWFLRRGTRRPCTKGILHSPLPTLIKHTRFLPPRSPRTPIVICGHESSHNVDACLAVGVAVCWVLTSQFKCEGEPFIRQYCRVAAQNS